LCDLSTLLGGFANTSGAPKPTRSTLNGQSVLEIKDSGDSAAGYISDSPTPELLQVNDPADGINLVFSDYGVPVSLTPPPASQVLDGSKYGF
jgi:hypothetical protein